MSGCLEKYLTLCNLIKQGHLDIGRELVTLVCISSYLERWKIERKYRTAETASCLLSLVC